jgi:hypothetical protein
MSGEMMATLRRFCSLPRARLRARAYTYAQAGTRGRDDAPKGTGQPAMTPPQRQAVADTDPAVPRGAHGLVIHHTATAGRHAVEVVVGPRLSCAAIAASPDEALRVAVALSQSFAPGHPGLAELLAPRRSP